MPILQEDVLQRVKELFVKNFDINVDELKPEATIESLGLDSLDKIEFMFELENEFSIRIPDREVKIQTIQDMVDVINRFVAEQRPDIEQAGRGA